jgi:hypothetical protein
MPLCNLATLQPCNLAIFPSIQSAGAMTTDRRLRGFVSIYTDQSALPNIRGHIVLKQF